MYNPFFADWTTLLLGGLTGLVFGFLLQKGKVTRYETIVGQFLLRDFTVLKVMLTAMAVGAVGIYGMLQLGMIDGLHLKSAQVVNNVAGGLIFGVGMAVLGYCPGTGVAAIGDGARDAVPGVLGMLVGAALFAEVSPWVGRVLAPIGDWGKITFADVTGLSPWVFVAVLVAGAVAVFLLMRKGVQPQAKA
ncbi:MAG: YeeE/YedE thiosulfate transporter family protein [Phycisphaerales bacterium JB063]